jgi:hypothetical protein
VYLFSVHTPPPPLPLCSRDWSLDHLSPAHEETLGAAAKMMRHGAPVGIKPTPPPSPHVVRTTDITPERAATAPVPPSGITMGELGGGRVPLSYSDRLPRTDASARPAAAEFTPGFTPGCTAGGPHSCVGTALYGVPEGAAEGERQSQPDISGSQNDHASAKFSSPPPAPGAWQAPGAAPPRRIAFGGEMSHARESSSPLPGATASRSPSRADRASGGDRARRVGKDGGPWWESRRGALQPFHDEIAMSPSSLLLQRLKLKRRRLPTAQMAVRARGPVACGHR